MDLPENISSFIRNNNFGLMISLVVLGYLIFQREKIAADLRRFKTHRREWLRDKWKNWGEPLLVALVLAIGIRTYLVGPYKIPTGSMIPTFMVGDRIFVDKLTYRFRPPARGEIVVFKYPLDKKKDFVKRLIGLPGDQVEIRDGKLFVNGHVLDEKPFSEHYYYNREDWTYGRTGQRIDVPISDYFVLGDNSAASSDSRNWGFVPKKNMIGKAFFIWWPPNRIKLAK